ncbi:MAG: universal stress protein [Nitrospirota bacterium]
MKKVLIPVDNTKGSKSVLATYHNLVQSPEEVILLHVERFEGRSRMIDMLGDAEMSTLKEMLRGTEYKEVLDKKAEELLTYYRKELQNGGHIPIKTLIREGHPTEEILKVAEEEGVDLIIMGHSRRSRLNRLITGSVSRDVGKRAKVPVLVAKTPIICEEPYSWRDAYTAIVVSTAVILGLFLIGLILQKWIFLP